ncbi:hypothetical protein IQ254_12695 [Nodosilinea sp. LEGE 07088]|uniref:hypothetical protein n=1 Tax=Nodosilinea sp. LEGE 07088 TaxID=2777968 RepID=UPI001882D2F0|nr:hypothetical protein [Nodosilinea sp. LEGE 07088]MBE9138037.1 hypothetical protein [Nodosilinea sp. LEGE 07088]
MSARSSIPFIIFLKDLEPFVDVKDMRLAFDKDGNVFLIAPDFSEPLEIDSSVHRVVQQEMHQIIARYRSIQSEQSSNH